jgi:hypothetical protein
VTITAKFPSVCRNCGCAIAVGSKIEWSKGSPAVHTTCPGRGTPKAERSRAGRAPSSRAPRAPKAAKIEGERTLRRRSADRHDRYYVDQPVRYDGSWWLVFEEGKERGNDDNGDYPDSWYCWARIRPATPGEAKAFDAERDLSVRKSTLAALPEWAVEQVQARGERTAEMPPSFALRFQVRGKLETTVLYWDGEFAWTTNTVYDDDRLSIFRMHVSHEAVAALGEAIRVLVGDAS